MKSAENNRAPVILVVFLAAIGVIGISRGATELGRTEPPPVPAYMDGEQAEVASHMVKVLFSAPYRRPLGAANIVVSALLVWAAALMVGGRKSAGWWASQGLVANILWTLAETASYGAAFIANDPAAKQLNAALAAQAGEPVGPTVVVALVLLMATPYILYAFLLYRVQRSYREAPEKSNDRVG